MKTRPYLNCTSVKSQLQKLFLIRGRLIDTFGVVVYDDDIPVAVELPSDIEEIISLMDAAEKRRIL